MYLIFFESKNKLFFLLCNIGATWRYLPYVAICGDMWRYVFKSTLIASYRHISPHMVTFRHISDSDDIYNEMWRKILAPPGAS